MYEVNKKLGIGFLEAVYQEALEIELKKAEIPYEREKPLPALKFWYILPIYIQNMRFFINGCKIS
jgi:GxxExxY protein